MASATEHEPHGAHQTRKATASGWIGSALEYYDFFIYATAASLVFPQLFFPSNDSAVAIAASLAKRTGLALSPCLSRTQSARQVGRRRSERLADPPSVRAVSPVPPRAVLVDDVMTTGATLAACSVALRGAGSSQVVAVTLAASMPSRKRLGAKARAA